MKLFQQLLLAPAALGLLAPVAASAADLNIAGVNQYATTDEQVTSITQFSDVQPTDWAYQALSNLIERYGCVAGYPNGTFKGRQALTRYEAAALLNACLDRITEVTDELKRLLKEFEKELAVLKGRVDGLEAKVGELEATQFSTTTKLQGEAYFTLGGVKANGNRSATSPSAWNVPVPAAVKNSAGATTNQAAIDRAKFLNSRGAANKYNARYGATTFSYDVRLNFLTSFTGKDLLYTRLRSGNFNNAFDGNGLNLTKLSYSSNSNDSVIIDRLYYSFPVGKEFNFTVGPKARNTEFLGVIPTAYGRGKGSEVLEFFHTYGAPGTYNRATGSTLAGVWKQNVKKGQGRFSVSASYVAPNGNIGTAYDGDPFSNSAEEGGIGTDAARASFLAQLAYSAPQWGVAAAYRFGQAGSNFRRGTEFVASNSWFLANGNSNSVALNGWWQPKTNGWFPSISAGWGLNSLTNNEVRNTGVEFATPYVTQSQSWFVGLQWDDAFQKGNSLGAAVGQPTFATNLNRGTNRNASTFSNDGNYVWEWWYKFQVTDNISITPAIFYLSNPLGQLSNSINSDGSVKRNNTFDNLGWVLTTRFKF